MKYQSLVTIFFIIVIGLASYLGFRPLFEFYTGGAIREFLSAIFGTIFTVILTMFLLNKQSEIEEDKAKNEVIYKDKVALYRRIINEIKAIVNDGKITEDEVEVLQFLFIDLTMVASNEMLDSYKAVYEEINNAWETDATAHQSVGSEYAEISDEQKASIIEKMIEFGETARENLKITGKISAKGKIDSFKKSAQAARQAIKQKKGRYGKTLREYVKEIYNEISNEEEFTRKDLHERVKKKVAEIGELNVNNSSLYAQLSASITNEPNRRHYGVNKDNMERHNLFYYLDESNKGGPMKKYIAGKEPTGLKVYFRDKQSKADSEISF